MFPFTSDDATEFSKRRKRREPLTFSLSGRQSLPIFFSFSRSFSASHTLTHTDMTSIFPVVAEDVIVVAAATVTATAATTTATL